MSVLLFSGGIESTCLALIHKPALLFTVNYGQKCARGEVRSSSLIAKKLNLKHEVIEVNICSLGSGDLSDSPALRNRKATEFWPFRNQFLITLAAMRCSQLELNQVIIGTIKTDNIHEDGRPEFLENINKLLSQQMPQIEVLAPAIDLDSETLIKRANLDQDLLGWTFSCYTSDVACGQCRGCQKTLNIRNRILKR